MRELQYFERVERSITKTYRKRIWSRFVKACKNYELFLEGDKVAVCISGGKDSMLLAVLVRMLQRISDVEFSVEYIVMDPGYNERNRKKIEENASLLGLDVHIFESDIFAVTSTTERNPCYLCARMRRGYLYSMARSLGCNKIALGHHFNDVVETTLIGMFYGSQLQAMPPKLHSTNFEGMELIRPLYMVHEEDIISWSEFNGLEFIQCACRFTESISEAGDGVGESKRQEVKELLKKLKEGSPDIEKSIFNSIHAVCLDTFPGYKTKGEAHSFLENFNKS